MTTNILKGSKGPSGGGGGGGVRTPDNLRSKDSVECVLALCEGPILGLKDGPKSFYIGDTALQNANGDYNFKTFALNFYAGLDNASAVRSILGGQTSNTPVNVNLNTNLPVVRTTNVIGGINFLEVRLAISRLLISNSDGTYQNYADFRIEYKATSSPTWIKLYNQDMIRITGKTSSTYVKEFRFEVPKISGSYDIRVTKLSPINTDTHYCDITFESFQEVLTDEKAYDNTALIQIAGEATDQFSSIPQWSGIYRGLLVKVPSNYNAVTRKYTGIWDGSWQIAYTNNPAWCLYDFIMNDRYGMKSYYIDLNIDKYDVYDAAVWCDELVPNGKGGLQPRYTFNALLTEATPGKEFARYIAGVFNGTFFDDLNGKAFLRVDKDEPAAHIFMKENIYTEGFEYTYTDITSRYNDITVTFVNPELDWNQDRRRVFDQSKIDQNGRIPLDFIAVGCNDSHEALRRAQHKLITANTENCIVSFKTNRLASYVNPFDIMLIVDSDMGYGVSGRIKTVSLDRKTVTLRTPVYLEVSVPYICNFTLLDGSQISLPISQIEPGYNTELNFDTALPENIPDKATFSLGAEGVIGLPRPFRVTKIEEIDGSPDSYSIEGININRNKWYDSDNLVDSGVIKYTPLLNATNPPGPTSCGFEERFIKDKSRFEITLSPVFNRGAYKYYSNDHSFEVWSRPSDTTEAYVKRDLLYGDTLIDHPYGMYDFKILGNSYLGFTTDIDSAATYVFNVTNPKTPPKDVDWLKINQSEIFWGYLNPPTDFAGFIVRYHNDADKTTWDDAGQPHQGVLSATSFYTNLIPPSARVIMVRAVDAFGVVSQNSAIIYKESATVINFPYVEQIDFHPRWTGTKVNSFSCSVYSGVGSANLYSGVGTNGFYVCPIYSEQLKALDTSGSFYSGVPTADFYTPVSSNPLYDTSYLEMTYTETVNITHTGYMFLNIDFVGSGYEALYKKTSDTFYSILPNRAEVEPGNYDIFIRVFGGKKRGIINSLSVLIEPKQIEEDIQDIVISSLGTRIPLTLSYDSIRVVYVIIQDDVGAATAVGYRVIDKDPVLGPLIKLVDSNGDFVSGLVDVIIKGYA